MWPVKASRGLRKSTAPANGKGLSVNGPLPRRESHQDFDRCIGLGQQWTTILGFSRSVRFCVVRMLSLCWRVQEKLPRTGLSNAYDVFPPPPFFFLWWNHILILSKVNVSLTRKRSLWAHFFSSAIHITHSYWCSIESWFCDFMQDLQPPMEGHCCLGSSTRSRLHPAQAEARAISLAVKIATARNWRTVIILSDAQDIALAIQQDRIPPWVCKTAIHADVKQLAVSCDVSECYWIPGTFNSSAHSLCRYGKRTARSELRFSEKCSPALLETNMEKMNIYRSKKKSYVIRTM